MTRHLQAIEGGKAPQTLEEIQRACKARAAEIERDPQLKADIERFSAQTHAKLRAFQTPAPRRTPGKAASTQRLRDEEI